MAGTKTSAGLAPSSAARRLARSACEQRVPLVADRAGAGEMRGRRPGARQHAAEPVVELGERLHFARPGPAAPRRRIAARLEAREALVHVVDEPGLAHLAVVDHVDSEPHLLVHDVADRRPEPNGVRGRVHGPARRSRGDHLEQIDGPRKAARVGREDPVRAPLHRISSLARLAASSRSRMVARRARQGGPEHGRGWRSGPGPAIRSWSWGASPVRAVLHAGTCAGTVGPMSVQKVTVHLEADLLKRARAQTGKGVTATIREGLELVAAGQVYDRLRALRGKVAFTIDARALRKDRR